MVRPALRSEVRLRYAAWLVALVVVLGASVFFGVARERSALPRAAEQLRLAKVDAGQFFSCFQGVNDELVPSGSAGAWTASSVRLANERLKGCDLDSVVASVEAVEVPPSAGLTGTDLREGRLAVEAASASLRRLILEAEGTLSVLERELLTGRGGAAIPLGTRAVEAAYLEASLWVSRATEALDV